MNTYPKPALPLSLTLIALVACGVSPAANPSATPAPAITGFEACVAAGNAVMESYPRQCRTAAGETFVEDIGNELEKVDLIRLAAPRPNQVIRSPLLIEGEARGSWFFEADFPIKLFDERGTLLATTIAQAQGDWMTEAFVPFVATLEFGQPDTRRGRLVLEKDNPSGLPEHNDALEVPVYFKE